MKNNLPGIRMEMLSNLEKSFLFNHKFHELEEEFWEVYRYINKKGIYGKIYQKNWKFIDKVVDIDKSKTVTYTGGLNDWILTPTYNQPEVHATIIPTYTQPEQHKKIYLNIAKQYK